MPSNFNYENLTVMPKINRSFMPPVSVYSPTQKTKITAPWLKTAIFRRLLLLILVFAPTFFAFKAITLILSKNGITAIEILLIIIYTLLISWVCVCSWTNIVGFLVLWHGVRFQKPEGKINPDLRVAVIMPISNEPVEDVFARLKATYLSLKNAERLENFHFFILSDTTDPDILIDEETAWVNLCLEVEGNNRIFYRRRRIHIKHKSGNIADFLRRWGRNYDYMALLDADSLFSAELLVRIVKIMEANPQIGILQTEPRAIDQKTLYSRIQQFAAHLYAPLFMAGMSFFQLGDAESWGHNSLIRIGPFMKCCNLPRLSRRLPLGGDIFSHDFVEAALMRRAGWEVWLAYGLKGSFEKLPPSLLTELRRDRRWCWGNFQHLRLFFARGISLAHRALFLQGIMHYASGFLWFLFLALGTLQLTGEVYYKPVYFPSGKSLFPRWPVNRWELSFILFTATITFLLIPKFLSAILILRKRAGVFFGGNFRFMVSLFSEIIFSSFLAPVKMLAHTYYVILALTGRPINWGLGTEKNHTGLVKAVKAHSVGMIIAVFWAITVYTLNRQLFFWTLPIIIPLIFIIPISMFTSYEQAGSFFKKIGLFDIPEEIHPSKEIIYLQSGFPMPEKKGFLRVLTDQKTNRIHRLIMRCPRHFCAGISKQLDAIEKKLLACGYQNLSSFEKNRLLNDPSRLQRLNNLYGNIKEENQ